MSYTIITLDPIIVFNLLLLSRDYIHYLKMDPLKSLVKKKRLFASFLKYDLLNQAAVETNLYSEEQGRELEELAQDEPVVAIERLLEIIRLHSTYEAFIQALERSIEIGYSQQRTIVDAQAHEQLINEIAGEKKPKRFKVSKYIHVWGSLIFITKVTGLFWTGHQGLKPIQIKGEEVQRTGK